MNEKQADTLLNVPEIVKRAKIALNLKRDSELASYLGVARATLSNWCARNSIDFPLLLNKLHHNWIVTALCRQNLSATLTRRCSRVFLFLILS